MPVSCRGRSGDEVHDGAFNMNHSRRRSNSLVDRPENFKTKFETIEPDPVFEEDVHGDGGEDYYADEHAHAATEPGKDKEGGAEMDVSSVGSSGASVDSGSVEEGGVMGSARVAGAKK